MIKIKHKFILKLLQLKLKLFLSLNKPKIRLMIVTGLELRGGILSASWMHELAASSRQYKIGERRLARHSEIFRKDSAVIKIYAGRQTSFTFWTLN